MLTKEQDKRTMQFDDGVVTEVEEDGDRLVLTYAREGEEYGLTFAFPLDRLGGQERPKVGDSIRVYGGFGHRVAGVDLRGEEVWYEDQIDRALGHRRMVLSQELEQLDKFAESKDELLAEYRTLPEVFRRRVDKFVDTKGAEWWWRYGPYEMACCRDGVLVGHALAKALGTEPGVGVDSDDLQEQAHAWFDAKRGEEVEGVDLANHSGNSWGFAQRLGYLWVMAPEQVVLEHGALVPLVGCFEYGCPHDESEEGEDG